jgi:diguanylate cyclase (GGDEF)-like protein/PAS domain S-box-containing protein
MLALVIASVACSALLMLANALHQRDEAVQRARSEAALLSRLAAIREERLGGYASPAPLTVEHELAAVAGSARDAGAVVNAGRGAALPEAVSFVIVDRSGRVLAEPTSTGPRRDSIVSAFAARSSSSWEQDVRDANGHRRVVAFTPLPHVGDTALWVGAGVDVDALLADQTRGLLNSLAAVFLLGLAVSLTAWGVGAGMLRRLGVLLEASRRLGSGDLAARTGLGHEAGELGALARQFDLMAETLQGHSNERSRADDRLRASEARKSAVLEASLDGIVLLDGDGRMMECNASARRMFGCDGRHCVHHHLKEMFREPLPFDSVNYSRSSDVFETSCRRLDSTELPVEISIAPIRDASTTGLYAATVRDITERKLWQQSLEKLSFMDELTGLYNRRGFLMFAAHQLKLAARSGQTVVLVGVDMDGLKTINDCFGHANGDRALIELAQALRSSFRDSDIIGRLGGDEFVVLATEQQEEGAEQALERFTMRMAGRNNEGDLPWHLSASVGWVRTQPTDPEDLGELLARVDERMYEHKRRGGALAGRMRSPGRMAAQSLLPPAPPADEGAPRRAAPRVLHLELPGDLSRAA